MSEAPTDALIDAFERVLPPKEERAEMSDDEFAQVVMDNKESAFSILRNRGYEIGKSAGEASPNKLIDGLYKSRESERIDGEMADEISKRFALHEVENRPPTDVASLAVFYGSEVESPGSSKGDYRTDD